MGKSNYKYKKLHPFKWFILQNYPFLEDSIDVLTNYELFCKLGEMINNQVAPINEMGEQVESLTNAFNDLYDWFENLDVQDEINNKLDEMAEDGTLQEIISEYLNSKAVFGFDSVESMKASTNLINGSYAKTLGYYTVNDGGAGLYKIRNVVVGDVEDNGLIIPISSELVAELIIKDNKVNIKQFGAKGDGETNDSTIIQNAINNVPTGTTILFPVGQYLITSKIVMPKSNTKTIKLEGINRNQSELLFNLTDTAESCAIDITGLSDNLNKCELKNLKITNIKQNDTSTTDGIKMNYNNQINVLENISIERFYNNIDLGDHNWSITLKNIRSLYARNFGIKAHGTINNVHLVGCDVLDNVERNISMASCKCCSVENSDFSTHTYGKYGLWLYNVNAINIENCYFESSDSNTSAISGIYSETSQGITINALDVSNDNSGENYKTVHIKDTKASVINGFTFNNTNTNRTTNVLYYENSYNNELGACFFANAKNCIYITNSSVVVNSIHINANLVNRTITTTSNGIVAGYIRDDIYKKTDLNYYSKAKCKLIGIDAKIYGPVADRPYVYQSGQVYYNTTSYKMIFGSQMPTFDENGNVTAGNTWVDANGQPVT